MNRREAVREIERCQRIVKDFLWNRCQNTDKPISAQNFVDLGRLQDKLDLFVESFKREPR